IVASKGMDCLVRLLLISALAATLVGCSSASQQMQAERGLYQTYHEPSLQVHSKRRELRGRTITAKKANARHRKNNNSTNIADSHIAPKVDASSFIRPDDKSNTVTTAPTAHDEPTRTDIPHDEATKTEIPPSSQLDDQSVIKKAKTTIAAKM